MPSFEFADLDGFTTGTVGPAGERIFFLQATAGDAVVTLKLEKQQVLAMAQYLGELLADLPALEVSDVESAPTLATPIEPLWVVGAMGAAYDASTDQIVLMAEEVTGEDEDEAASVATFRLSPGQTKAFIERAHELVEAGRPPCPYCARPLNHGEGGFCPCWN